MSAITCERCGEQLAHSYSTTAYSGTGQTMQLAPDGAGCVIQLGGMVACSWNCLAVLAAQRAGSTGDAAVRIVAERERQVTGEGWSPEHDAGLPAGELATAAGCYLARAVGEIVGLHARPEHPVTARVDTDGDHIALRWPWDPEWWKPKSPDRDLIRAGALIAAEADRDPAGRRQVTGEPF